MKKFKTLETLLLVGALTLSSSVIALASVNENTIQGQAKDGYVVDSVAYDTAELVGISPRATVVMNSWVERYRNSSSNNYYASGGVHLINNANGLDVYHSTTVTLEKGSTTLVTSGKAYGTGNVEATTSGATPTAGSAHVYYSY